MPHDYENLRRTDDELDRDEAEELALRKLIFGLVDEDTYEMGTVEASGRIIDRLTEIERENKRLQERVGEFEAEVNPHPESKPYQELSKDEKVQQIRESLVEKASARNNGRFAMEYKDVMWLFDGHPSAGHTYNLMGLAGVADGFEYQQLDDRPHRIVVNLDAVNDESVFHAVKNGLNEVGL